MKFSHYFTNIRSKVSKDRHFKELLTGSGLGLVFRVLGLLIGFLFNFFFARFFGAEVLGNLYSGIAITSLLALVARCGLDTAFLRQTAQNWPVMGQALRSIMKKSMVLIIGGSVLLTIGLMGFCDLYLSKQDDYVELAGILRIMAWGILPLGIIAFFSEGLRGLKKIGQYSFYNNTSKFAFAIALSFISYLLLDNDNAAYYSFVLGLFITALLTFVSWRKWFLRKAYEAFKTTPEELSFKSTFRLARPLFWASSTNYLMNWTDTMFLTYMAPSAFVGYYNTALRLSTLSKLSILAIDGAVAPKFAELGRNDDKTELKRVLGQSTRLIFWTSLPMILVLLFFPSFLLGLFGQDFTIAKGVVIILSLGQFIAAISGSVGHFLQMTGHEKVFRNILILSLLINIGLNFILTPMYGMHGTAISVSFSLMVRNLGCVFYIYKKYDFLSIYIPFYNSNK